MVFASKKQGLKNQGAENGKARMGVPARASVLCGRKASTA
jgi:hypothetical protein